LVIKKLIVLLNKLADMRPLFTPKHDKGKTPPDVKRHSLKKMH